MVIIDRTPLIVLVVIIVAACTGASLAGSLVVGLHDSVTYYLGGGDRIVVVYSPKSSTPYTGIIPLATAVGIENTGMASRVSPEVIAFAFIDDEPVFIRGIIVGRVLESISVVKGEMISDNDLMTIVIGYRLADRLGLRVGDYIYVRSAFRGTTMPLYVKGIVRTGTPMDDEVITTLQTAQIIRGLRTDQVTIIRVLLKPGYSEKNLMNAMRGKLVYEKPGGLGNDIVSALLRLVATRPKLASQLGIASSTSYMEKFMGRYGLSSASALLLSALVITFSLMLIWSITRTILVWHKERLLLLREVGALKNSILRMLLKEILLTVLLASIAGGLTGSYLYRVIAGKSLILAHASHVASPLVIILFSVLTALMTAFIGIISVLKEIA